MWGDSGARAAAKAAGLFQEKHGTGGVPSVLKAFAKLVFTLKCIFPLR